MLSYSATFHADPMLRDPYGFVNQVSQKVVEEVEKIIRQRPGEDWEQLHLYIIQAGWDEFWHGLRYQVIICNDPHLDRHNNEVYFYGQSIFKMPNAEYQHLLLRINRFHVEPNIMDTP